MSKISIKKDFADGNILPASDLNNNFRVIEAGINANEENLEIIIEQAIVRLDAELEAITANRGWDWNGGDRVTFFKGTTAQVADQDVINGQLLYNTDTGETALDDDGERITTGSGNVVVIDDYEPENPATKLWVDGLEPLNDIGTEVVHSMSGNEMAMAPSVSSVKGYVGTLSDLTTTAKTNIVAAINEVNGKTEAYSTSEALTNKVWINNKPIYRKTIYISALPNNTTGSYASGISNVDYVVNMYGSFQGSGSPTGNKLVTRPLNFSVSAAASQNIYGFYNIDTGDIKITTASDLSFMSGYVTLEYTKTTDQGSA